MNKKIWHLLSKTTLYFLGGLDIVLVRCGSQFAFLSSFIKKSLSGRLGNIKLERLSLVT